MFIVIAYFMGTFLSPYLLELSISSFLFGCKST